MEKAVEVYKLSHKYKKVPVIKNISFSVKTGSFFIIAGPNGAGKTTLLKIMCGIEPFSSGKVTLMDRLVSDYRKKELAQKAAFVSQHFSQDIPFTVADIVLMGRAPYAGFMGIESKQDILCAKDAMDFTDVSSMADRKLTTLSGGEKQRVFIARAIAQSPDIIFLDEPTASLDLSAQIKIMDLMSKLSEQTNMTVIMVSHDLNLASMYADTVLLLKQGQVAKLGSPKEIFTEKNLEPVYECSLNINKNSEGIPFITPISRYKTNNRIS